jgi:hypothetical protein
MDTTNPRARGPQLLVLHPHQLEDAQTLIQAVKRNQTVVLNASSADERTEASALLRRPERQCEQILQGVFSATEFCAEVGMLTSACKHEWQGCPGAHAPIIINHFVSFSLSVLMGFSWLAKDKSWVLPP